MQDEGIQEDFQDFFQGISMQELIYPFATVLLFLGPAIFPDPPRILYAIAMRSSLFQWMLVYVLVWQGGAQRDIYTSFYITFAAYIITQLLNFIFPMGV